MEHEISMRDFFTQRLSAYESGIMKEILKGNDATLEVGKRVNSLEDAMSNYKFGWKLFTTIGAFCVGALYLFFETVKFLKGIK